MQGPLTAIDKNTVQSSDGWQVSIIGNSPATWKLRYSEHKKNIEIDIEAATGGPRNCFWYVYLSKVNKWLDSNFEPVTQSDHERIGSNICRAMEYQGDNCQIM